MRAAESEKLERDKVQTRVQESEDRNATQSESSKLPFASQVSAPSQPGTTVVLSVHLLGS